MEVTSSDAVRSLPVMKREAEVKSRRLRGFHVFRLHFLEDFLKLTLEQQMDLLRKLLGVLSISVSDEDSTDTAGPTGREIRQLVSRWWSEKLPSITKTAWEDRAKSLNARPVPGRFYRLGRGFNHQLEDLVKFNLEVEWRNLCCLLKTCLSKEVKDLSVALTMTQSKAVVFGRERVAIGDLSLRTMTMSPLIRCALFGMGEESLLRREVVYKSKQVTVVHLASLRRVKQIFTVAGVSGLETLVGDGRRHVACGRVALVRRGRHLTGFVIGEAGNQLIVKLESGEEVKIPRPKYVEEKNFFSGRVQGFYKFRQQSGSRFKVEAYWPVRLAMTRKGRIRFLFSRSVLDAEGNIVPAL